jgi:hypothetical protein
MYSFLTKNGQTIAFVAGVVLSLIFVILVMTHDLTEGLGPESFSNKTPDEVAEFSSKLTQFDFGLYVTYALMVIVAVAAIGFGLTQFVSTLIDNPMNAIRTIAIIVGLIVFFFIGKAIAPSVDSKPVMAAAESFSVTPSQRGLISGGINLTLIVILAAVGSLIVSEIRNLFK